MSPQHKKDTSSIAFCGQRICTRCKHSHSLWRNLQEMILGTTHGIHFLFFLNWLYLLLSLFWFLPMITFASAKIFIATHSPIRWRQTLNTCNASQYHRASPIGKLRKRGEGLTTGGWRWSWVESKVSLALDVDVERVLLLKTLSPQRTTQIPKMKCQNETREEKFS